MKPISKELLKACAENLMFTMTEEQFDTLEKEFDILTKQMENIGKVKGIDESEPMIFPFPCYVTEMREDCPMNTLTKAEVLKNAKDVLDGQIRLPKVVK